MFKTVGSVKRTSPALPIEINRSARAILRSVSCYVIEGILRVY